jgi:hypothetical protein
MLKTKLTIYFENPFWVGIFEKTDNNNYSAFRLVFPVEPKDADIYDLILNNYSVINYSTAVKINGKTEKCRINPKRLQKVAKNEMTKTNRLKKAYIAINKEREKNKKEKIKNSKIIKLEKEKLKFSIKKQKRKDKHRGR